MCSHSKGPGMTLRERQEIFTRNVSKLIEFIFDSGYTCTLGECWRSKEQAEFNVSKGIGILNSLHRARLAIDLNIFKGGIYSMFDKDYQPAGEYWETLNENNRWGGRFKDGNHFEMRLE